MCFALRIDRGDERFAAAAAQAVEECLRESALRLDEIDAIVAAPAQGAFRAALAARLGVRRSRHHRRERRRDAHRVAGGGIRPCGRAGPRQGGRILLVAAGAGITAGAAIVPAARPAVQVS